MKNVLEEIKSRAKALNKTIVLCEGEDSRVVKAASDATKEGIAKIVLLGDEAQIKANNPEIDLTGVTIINPLPETLDVANLDDCTVAVSLAQGDVFADDSGKAMMKVTVYNYECYDMADIAALAEHDVIVRRGEEIEISTPDSKVKVYVVPTNEELAIARETVALL